MSKLYIYKCANISFLFLFLYKFFFIIFTHIRRFLPWFPLLPTWSPHSQPYSSQSYPDSSYLFHSQPDSQHSHRSLRSVPRFPILAFTVSLVKCTLNESALNCVPRVLSSLSCFMCLRALRAHVLYVLYMPLCFCFYRSFLFLRELRAFIFNIPLLAFIFLPNSCGLIFYVPEFF